MSDPTFFDGETITPSLDNVRLATLMERVTLFMGDNQWHTLREIADRCRGSEASVSARLRDLRKDRHGNRYVSKQRVKDAPGLWQYRLDPF